MKILPVNTIQSRKKINQSLNFNANLPLIKPDSELNVEKLEQRKLLEIIEQKIINFEKEQENKLKNYQDASKSTPIEKIPFGPATAKNWDEYWSNQNYYNNLIKLRDFFKKEISK